MKIINFEGLTIHTSLIRISKILILAAIFSASNLVVPTASNAASCKIVTAVYEDYSAKGKIDGTYGFKTRAEIAIAVKAYKIRWDNPECVSDKALTDLASTVLNLQQGCATKKPSSMTFADWQSRKNFWRNLYTKNFFYACEQWNTIRLR